LHREASQCSLPGRRQRAGCRGPAHGGIGCCDRAAVGGRQAPEEHSDPADGYPGRPVGGRPVAPLMLKSDFIKALDQVQEEKGISKQSLLSLMETALATAYRRAFNPTEGIRVHVDPDTAQIAIFGRRRVVETVADPATEISLEDAIKQGPASLGDLVDVPLPTEDFARLAAQIS